MRTLLRIVQWIIFLQLQHKQNIANMVYIKKNKLLILCFIENFIIKIVKFFLFTLRVDEI